MPIKIYNPNTKTVFCRPAARRFFSPFAQPAFSPDLRELSGKLKFEIHRPVWLMSHLPDRTSYERPLNTDDYKSWPSMAIFPSVPASWNRSLLNFTQVLTLPIGHILWENIEYCFIGSIIDAVPFLNVTKYHKYTSKILSSPRGSRFIYSSCTHTLLTYKCLSFSAI